MNDQLSLTTAQLACAIATARLGEPHPCVTPTPRSGVAEPAWAEFVRLGLVSRSGALLPEFVDVLAMLVRPQAECSAWISGPGGTQTAVLAASIGTQAVLARRSGEQVSLRPADPDALIEQVVRELPPHPDGTGHSITVRQADFTAAPESKVDTDVVALRRLIGRPRRGCAQLSVARRTRNGKRLRVERPLTVLDTDGAGRWCTYLDVRDEPWIVAAPAYGNLLVSRLAELS
jgi:hypothetical protein